jgi:hypothetical protein
VSLATKEEAVPRRMSEEEVQHFLSFETFVSVRGRAELVEGAEDMLDWATRIAERER